MRSVEIILQPKQKIASLKLCVCALGETRTPNPLRELAPEASAYTNSATKAYISKMDTVHGPGYCAKKAILAYISGFIFLFLNKPPISQYYRQNAFNKAFFNKYAKRQEVISLVPLYRT